jgi:hypothetical protein
MRGCFWIAHRGSGGGALAPHAGPRLANAIREAGEYRRLGLPVIDTTGRTPAAVAAELARFVRSRHSSGDPADTGCRCLRAGESGCTKDQ